LIVRRFGAIEDKRLGFEVLFDDSCFVVASAQRPWARRRRIALAELVNEPWVLPPRESGIFGPVATEAFGGIGLDYPRSTVVTDSPQVRMSLLATGRFLTILPAYALTFPTGCPALKVLPIELPKILPVGIATLKDRTLSPTAHLFIDCAREVAKPLAGRKMKRRKVHSRPPASDA
jgi:DNA-binding transcriptional LysR family regulator